MALPKASQLINKKKEKGIFAKLMFPFLMDGYEEGVEIGSSQGSGKIKPTDIIDRKTITGIKKLSLDAAARAAKTSETRLKTAIKQVLEKDGTVQDLATVIKQKYQNESRARAVLIARTELTGVIGQGTADGLEAEGYKGHQWVTGLDGR